MTQINFEKDKFGFVKKPNGVMSILAVIAKWIAISFAIAVCIYFILALFVSTDRESKIERENEYMEEQYESMSKQLEQIDEVIAGLELRDKKIYQDLFQTVPQDYSMEDASSLDLSSLYLQSLQNIVWISHSSNVDIANKIYRTDNNIKNILDFLDEKGKNIQSIPSILPIRDFHIAQTGASVGRKVSPFLKNFKDHDGLDMMAPLGTDVRATADGIVSKVEKTKKGSGNRVEVRHSNGYVTSYSHLSDILVRSGQRVEQGSVIGRVGSSGMSFVTHLHYSIYKDGIAVDPLHYFFAELSPDDYKRMINLAINTGQSMD